jgi:hypothetical protein
LKHCYSTSANRLHGSERFILQKVGIKIDERLSDRGETEEAIWEGAAARPHWFPTVAGEGNLREGHVDAQAHRRDRETGQRRRGTASNFAPVGAPTSGDAAGRPSDRMTGARCRQLAQDERHQHDGGDRGRGPRSIRLLHVRRPISYGS